MRKRVNTFHYHQSTLLILIPSLATMAIVTVGELVVKGEAGEPFDYQVWKERNVYIIHEG